MKKRSKLVKPLDINCALEFFNERKIFAVDRLYRKEAVIDFIGDDMYLYFQETFKRGVIGITLGYGEYKDNIFFDLTGELK